MDWRIFLKKAWHFIWEEDSILSWIVNIILAFILIKFIVYPAIGFVMQTGYPVVAVVSGSMEHKTVNPCISFDQYTNSCDAYDTNLFSICGKDFSSNQKVDLDFFWKACGQWYLNNTLITKDSFSGFMFSKGFNKGDIMVLRGYDPEDLDVGDTIVYMSRTAQYPIIHRVVDIKKDDSRYTFITKGDHNSVADAPVDQDQLIGKAVVRVPYLGWIKIGFVEMINILKGVFYVL